MDNEEIENYIKAGKIAAQALEYGKNLIKKGVFLVEVVDKVEEKIFSLGGKPAFPAQVSCNQIAAHYCPEQDDKTIFSDQVVSLDVGVHINGYIADNAVTVDLSGKHEDLVKASREALENAVKKIKPGISLAEIGRTIQETIQKYNFSPVRNLSGHGLAQYTQHTKPNIPNFENNDNSKIKEGMVFAVEPFASTGAGIVEEAGIPTVFSLEKIKPVRSPITREVLKELENYENLPFTSRWLTKKFGARTKIALRELEQLGIIHSYPPLVDRNKGLVSQAEHTVLVDDDGKVIVTTK